MLNVCPTLIHHKAKPRSLITWPTQSLMPPACSGRHKKAPRYKYCCSNNFANTPYTQLWTFVIYIIKTPINND